MTTTEHTSTSTPATAAASLVPYVCVSDSAAAIDWYVAVFDAVETVRYVGDDGRIGHAEVSIGSARLMLSDEYPEIGVVGPQTLGGTPFTLNLNVDDVDAVWARAIEHGADGERPPTDQPYGERSCTFRDPSGHRWIGADDDRHSDAGRDRRGDGGLHRGDQRTALPRLLLRRDGSRRARVLHARLHRHGDGVTLLPRAVRLADRAGERRAPSTPTSTTRSSRSGSRPTVSTARPCCTSGSLTREAYAAKVRDLGGTVVSEATYDSGGSVVCRDDQGREFQLWQPAPGY